MTISNSYRLFFSGKILMLLMQLNNYSRKFKLSKPVPSRESVVIMEENLRMPDLKNSANNMAFRKSFHPPLLLNRIGLWSRKIGLFNRWLE
jgi:hypothetical protein